MKIAGNTILITGGGTGIGRRLAELLKAEGNDVIIAGKYADALAETVAANPGIKSYPLDVDDGSAIRSFAAAVVKAHPALNVLMNVAGIMRTEVLTAGPDYLADAEAIVSTNLLGPIRMTAAFLPHLMAQPDATILNVSSGLGFVPISRTPTYCATKAAIHSYSQSLRRQLRDTSVKVIELPPPAVQTDLGPGLATNPAAQPVDAFAREVVALLKENPDAEEILVERTKIFRFAEAKGEFDAVFKMLNP